MNPISDLKIPQRLLMGPGPSDVSPRVLKALSMPIVGHLDPEFLKIMEEVKELLRFLFRTENELTLPMSGTGSAGMETVFCNLIEPGDEVVVCVNGVFGERMCDVAGRCGAKVLRVEAPWGRIVEPDDVRKVLTGARAKLVAIVHAETSTGVWQPLEEISEYVHGAGSLLAVDCVTSLGGIPFEMDKWRVDACYSGTQKCLSCPPGLSPVSFGPEAVKKIDQRKTKVQSWYLDLTMIRKYWGRERVYHHTAPISMIYALREALRIVQEEGLESRFKRHAANAKLLVEGLKKMGFEPFAQEGHRLPMLTTVKLPPHLSPLPHGGEELKNSSSPPGGGRGEGEGRIRQRLLEECGIEIGGGLGPVKGKIWRVGLMGETSQPKNVMRFLQALEEVLKKGALVS
jgi:alanine-glyoxylate transaminase/serine-glyoxylate transaminase/serine-pyruvate transaminase